MFKFPASGTLNRNAKFNEDVGEASGVSPLKKGFKQVVKLMIIFLIHFNVAVESIPPYYFYILSIMSYYFLRVFYSDIGLKIELSTLAVCSRVDSRNVEAQQTRKIGKFFHLRTFWVASIQTLPVN